MTRVKQALDPPTFKSFGLTFLQNDFEMRRNTTKSYGAQYLKFSILRISEKMFELAPISQNE